MKVLKLLLNDRVIIPVGFVGKCFNSVYLQKKIVCI